MSTTELEARRAELLTELAPHRAKIENLLTSRDFYRGEAAQRRREHLEAIGQAALLACEIEGEQFFAQPLETMLKEVEAAIEAAQGGAQ